MQSQSQSQNQEFIKPLILLIIFQKNFFKGKKPTTAIYLLNVFIVALADVAQEVGASSHSRMVV